MNAFMIGMISFLMGIACASWLFGSAPKDPPDAKVVPSAIDLAYSKALVNCISHTDMTDYQCVRFLNGGHMASPSPSPEPSPKGYSLYDYYKTASPKPSPKPNFKIEQYE